MKVSIVVPVYYNAPSLPLLHQRFADIALTLANLEFEFIFVDDGSGDDSFAVLNEIAQRDPRVRVIKLVRNFGSNLAILAGFTHATGDCSIVITADLQDPPELIPDLIARWRAGWEVVLAVRTKRHDPFIARAWASVFNRLYKQFVFPNFPPDGFDLFLASRRVIELLIQYAGPNLYLFGLLLWTGYPFDTVTYTRGERPFGKSRWTFNKKVKYFMDAFVGFSYLPLRLSSIVGLGLAMLGFAYAALVIVLRLMTGIPIEGWASLMVVLLLVSGTQLAMLGIVGEYLWRNLDEARRRPLFLIDRVIGAPNNVAAEHQRDPMMVPRQ
jgi:dolichol-phosphate mannosyltransferase